MCAVLNVFWVLVVTLSLVSFGVTTQTQYQVQISFLLDFVLHFCTCSQTVFCDRQFLSVANYCTLLHRENGSLEVLSLQLMTPSRVSELQITSRLQTWRQVFVLAQGHRSTAKESKEGWKKRVCGPCSTCEAIGLCISGREAAEAGHQLNETKKACANWSRSFTVGQTYGMRIPSLGDISPHSSS